MLSRNSRIVIGAIIALLLIVTVYVVAQPRVIQNQDMNFMDTETAKSGASNTETHTGSDGKILPTAVATTQPAASDPPAQEQQSKAENTNAIKIIAYKIAAYGDSPSAGFNFGKSSIDRYCIYKLQETNKTLSVQKHAEYWMDYIATYLEGMHNISEFEQRYNLTQSSCVERLTANINNGSKPVENAEKMLVTVK
ncbi:hypothetical protein [Candidatus Methanoperedens nitratireducens]|uniref:Uncharacterized protein n=1 Tax=Candidatus Methanoperedens nitratireducens TaxID=1392998 RepID=A0A284VL84_9EURY|nr:hypothetical protein [Candidatus Methanoperedens nitroreducens]SNQ60040.1 exported hypothetical protein [Candidatus Methanoperedens nitroreducens]